MVAPLVAGALIGGGASLVGGLISGSQSRNAAREQMRFQERMRSTQYQTAVQDMRAAGLNPMLAYDQGGAGTPSGAQAEVPDFGRVASSASDMMRTRAEVDVMKAQSEKLREEKEGVQLSNIEKSAYLGVGFKLSGEGIDHGVPESSAFAADMRRAREQAALAVYERGLGANAYAWRNVNQTARTLSAASDAFAKIRFGVSGLRGLTDESGRRSKLESFMRDQRQR